MKTLQKLEDLLLFWTWRICLKTQIYTRCKGCFTKCVRFVGCVRAWKNIFLRPIANSLYSVLKTRETRCIGNYHKTVRITELVHFCSESTKSLKKVIKTIKTEYFRSFAGQLSPDGFPIYLFLAPNTPILQLLCAFLSLFSKTLVNLNILLI